MSIERLNKAKQRLDHYEKVLADIDEVLRSKNPSVKIRQKHHRYQQYVANYRKKYEDALKALHESYNGT